MPKSIIIIGAGIAGLSAGCYAQMNNYQAQIFELHTIPGGLCTSWRRHGYLFDGGMRYLVGVSPAAKSYPMWQELGVLPGRGIYHYDEFICVEDKAGRAFHLYTNIDRLEAHMLALSPADCDVIGQFADAVRAFATFDLPLDLTPDDSLENLQLGLSMLPFTAPLLRWKDVTLGEYVTRFHDPLLREGLRQFLQFARPDFPVLMLLITLAQMHKGIAGYPLGGSLALAESITHRFLKLGGQIDYEARVTEILVEADHAVGVRLADGTEHRADYVLSAADGRTTIFDLLGGRYVDAALQNTYQTMPLAPSILQIALGVAHDFASEPPALCFPLAQPIDFGDLRHQRLTMRHYCFDPSMAPAGKSVLSVWCEADYGYWKGLHVVPAAYATAKGKIAQQVIGALARRYPGLAAQVETVDVATPVTYERYTANWRGSIYGWAMTMRKMALMMGKGMAKTLPGLHNFYMIGQWVEPSGNIQLSAGAGRDALEVICGVDGRPFSTALPAGQQANYSPVNSALEITS
ncbi:MAG: NAD(P)/FAD-dependent oxidoreductase [Chloroflexi bacterium]|nr:NAD(P)/FAD-dependent oxidoreductase [Chloroflexota bacterium]